MQREPDQVSALARRAAEWVVRRDAGLTSEEAAGLRAWLEADTRHREAFARAEREWHALDGLRGPLVRNSEAIAMPRGRFRAWRAAGWGIAAALALGLGVAWQRQVAAHGVIAATSGPTEQRLDDGSVVRVNEGALVRVSYSRRQRAVALERGAGHFVVARDAARPFVVRAGSAEARAIGTAFQVTRIDGGVEVVVLEGRVAVAMSGAEVATLAAGDQLQLEDAIPRASPAAVTRLSLEEQQARIAWMAETMEFANVPLAQVVAELNRRNVLQLVLADPELGVLPVVASIRSDNLEGLVRALETTFGVQAVRSGNEIVLRRTR